MTGLSQEEVKRLSALPEWQALERHLKEARALLDSVSGIEGDQQERGMRVTARQEAKDIIDKILEPFGFSFTESSEGRNKSLKRIGLG